MESQTLEFEGSGGVSLIADAWGDPDADPILFMHGGGQTRLSWGGAAELWAGKGGRTLSVDLRGHGDSGWSPNGDYEAVHFVADINAVLSQLGRKAVLVGASLGGRTATFIVGNGAPNLCRALGVVDITPKIEAKGAERILAFMNKHPNGFTTVEDAADAVAEYREHRSRQKTSAVLKRTCACATTAGGTGIGIRNSSTAATHTMRKRRARSAKPPVKSRSPLYWCAAAAATWSAWRMYRTSNAWSRMLSSSTSPKLAIWSPATGTTRLPRASLNFSSGPSIR